MTDQVLIRALKALEPVKERFVVVGGAAHRLFPQHASGQTPNYELLTTEDVDLAAGPLELHDTEEPNLVRLLEQEGFEERVEGADGAGPPAYKYYFLERPGAYVQFIAPLTGSGERRNETPDRSLRFSGIHGEKLRHVDLLLYEPWHVRLGSADDGVSMQVVNPVGYLLQKLVGLERRPHQKQGKDILYVYDTLAIFGESLSALTSIAQGAELSLTKRQVKTIRSTAHELCFVESDPTREAAVIAGSQRRRAPTAEQIAAACKFGLKRVLGPLISDL